MIFWYVTNYIVIFNRINSNKFPTKIFFYCFLSFCLQSISLFLWPNSSTSITSLLSSKKTFFSFRCIIYCFQHCFFFSVNHIRWINHIKVLLNLHDPVVLEFIITFNAIFCVQIFSLVAFLVHQLIHIYAFKDVLRRIRKKRKNSVH